VKFTAWMRSIVPIDHLQVVCNGQVVRDLKLAEDRQSANVEGTLPVSSRGWCVLRAWSEKAEYPILDLYPYATTSPIYIDVDGSSSKPKEDAAYFIAWIDRLAKAAKAHPDWNTEAEKNGVLDMMSRARRVYENLEK
jgi:TolB protein